MIVGNYYINNFLVLGLVLAVGGGTAYVADVPGMMDGGSSQKNPSGDYNISMLGGSTEAGSSQVIRFVKDDGSAVSGAEVFVNDQKVGETGESGELAFEVPDSESITVSASKSGVEVERVFDVEDSDTSDSDGSGSDDETSGGESEDSSQDDQNQGGSEDDQSDQNDGNETSEEENSTGKDNETDSEDNFQPTFIERTSPEDSQLPSSTFDLGLELGANNSDYRVSLGGEQKLSGEIDGNKTVSSILKMPRNGTVGLLVEIVKDGEVEASKNYSLNFDSGDESDGSDAENNVTAKLSSVGTVSVGEQFTLNASESTGVIDTYSWQLGNGEVENTETPELDHSYSETGDYEVSLTVEGPNISKDSTSITVSVESGSDSSTKTPEINFISPVDGFETDKSTLEYEFEVENTSSSSTYSIMIDNSEVSSGGLDEGNNTVQRTVEVPETAFNTSVQVTQGGETYTSEERTITSSTSVPEPDIFLREPEEGSEYSSTQIGYNFTVYNGVEGSTYRIIADGNSVKEGQLSKDGTITLDPTVTVSEGEFTTKIEVEQGGQTYTSETKTVTAGADNTPDIQLVSPSDGGSVSTFDSQTEVTFEYDVEKRGWAESAELVVDGQIEAETQLYSESSTKTETITLDSGNTYNWEVHYLDGDGQQASTPARTLDVVQEKPVDSLDLTVDESVGENWEVGFNMTLETEVERTLKLFVDGDEKYSNDIREPVSDTFNKTLIFESKGEYEAEAVLYEIGTDNVVKRSSNITFETTEDAPTGGGSSN